MPTQEIEYGQYEYRSQGGEIQRRPREREGLSVWEAAWLVLHKDESDESKMIPSLVLAHFKQAQGATHLRFD